jgi:hypothetical protein
MDTLNKLQIQYNDNGVSYLPFFFIYNSLSFSFGSWQEMDMYFMVEYVTFPFLFTIRSYAMKMTKAAH